MEIIALLKISKKWTHCHFVFEQNFFFSKFDLKIGTECLSVQGLDSNKDLLKGWVVEKVLFLHMLSWNRLQEIFELFLYWC